MALRPCLYRKLRPVEDGTEVEIVCIAGGNHRLGITGSDLTCMRYVCGQCPIPDVLTEESKACLYLIPMRIFGEAEAETLYQCRALYNINPERADKSPCLNAPGLCPWWFPHPIEFLPPGTEWHTHRARGLYLGEIEKPAPPPLRLVSVTSPEPSSRWRCLLSWIAKRVL
jgi:hypothetical protein